MARNFAPSWQNMQRRRRSSCAALPDLSTRTRARAWTARRAGRRIQAFHRRPPDLRAHRRARRRAAGVGSCAGRRIQAFHRRPPDLPAHRLGRPSGPRRAGRRAAGVSSTVLSLPSDMPNQRAWPRPTTARLHRRPCLIHGGLLRAWPMPTTAPPHRLPCLLRGGLGEPLYMPQYRVSMYSRRR